MDILLNSEQVKFSDLGLATSLLNAVITAGYTQPTPIQAQAIPQVIAGNDVLAAAQTGTGKTAGFTLPILHRLLTKPRKNAQAGTPRVVILTPTRELAAQVFESVQLYSQDSRIRSLVLYGGVNINPQIRALQRPVDIVVATPGRLLDHCQQKTLDLSKIEILVLDEADRMLDMGFIHDIRKVLRLLPKERQNLLFSATFSNEIRELAHQILVKPVEVAVAARNTASELITQHVIACEQSHKTALISHLIDTSGWHQVLVFCRTKHGANRLAERLTKNGLNAAALHGNKSQSARTRALDGFKTGKIVVLVATDIAARGIDIDQLPYVINFELPQVAEDYVHRIGRTGRAGSEGVAISLVAPGEERMLSAIERLIKRNIDRIPAPEDFVPPSRATVAAEQQQDRERPPMRDRRRDGSSGMQGRSSHRSEGAGQGRRGPRSDGGGQGRTAGSGQGRGNIRSEGGFTSRSGPGHADRSGSARSGNNRPEGNRGSRSASGNRSGADAASNRNQSRPNTNRSSGRSRLARGGN